MTMTPERRAELERDCEYVLEREVGFIPHAVAQHLARALKELLAEQSNLCDDGAPHIFRSLVVGQTTKGVIGLPVTDIVCTKCRERKSKIDARQPAAMREG